LGARGWIVRVRRDAFVALSEAGGEPLGLGRVPSGDPDGKPCLGEEPRGMRSENAIAAEDHDHRLCSPSLRRSRETRTVHRL
jgi:hypothetical protein